MSIDIETLQRFIVALVYERGKFVPRQDLLIDSKSIEPEYSSKYLKVQSSSSDDALGQLIEDGVLVEYESFELLEEIIRTGMPEDDAFTHRSDIRQADRFDGDSIISFGPRLSFFVINNFSYLVELSEEQSFHSFKEFCFEVASANDARDPAPDSVFSRSSNENDVQDIIDQLNEIERRLRFDNDLGVELSSKRDIFLAEVLVLKQLVSLKEFRPVVVYAMAKRTLGWIAEKSAEAVVGGVAIALLARLAGLF